jgi:hypothetical protein
MSIDMKDSSKGRGTIERPAGSGSSGDVNFSNYNELKQIAIGAEKAASTGEKTTVISEMGGVVDVYRSRDGSEVIVEKREGNYIRLDEGNRKSLTKSAADWLKDK